MGKKYDPNVSQEIAISLGEWLLSYSASSEYGRTDVEVYELFTDEPGPLSDVGFKSLCHVSETKLRAIKAAAQKRVLESGADIFAQKAVAYWWKRHPKESRVSWTKKAVCAGANGYYQGMTAQGRKPTLSHFFAGQEENSTEIE